MKLTYDNRIALVTGAGRGIGRAIALKFAEAGMTVICVSKSETCEAVAKEINDVGGKASAYKVDVADSGAVVKACEEILEKYEKVDVLVNNAGITRDNLMLRMSDEEWESVIQTNLSSMFYWTKNLLRPMTSNRWGRIINVSSVVGLIGNPGQFNYCAAKAGMLGATKSLAREVAGRKVTVNAIAPGFIATDMTSGLSDAISEQIKKSIPMKRMGEADDIANAALFIASEESGYMTGQVFSVDGGMAM